MNIYNNSKYLCLSVSNIFVSVATIRTYGPPITAYNAILYVLMNNNVLKNKTCNSIMNVHIVRYTHASFNKENNFNTYGYRVLDGRQHVCNYV